MLVAMGEAMLRPSIILRLVPLGILAVSTEECMLNRHDILDWLTAESAAFTGMADDIWSHPETGFRERRASRIQAAFLSELGFRVRWNLGGMETAFVAEWGTGRPVLGLLGEYDALAGLSQKRQPTPMPEVRGGPGHGCGHNLLGTGCVAAAAALRRWLEAAGRPGTVRYYGCPAEERVTGKVFMARDGAFSDLDAALNWHPGDLNMPGKDRAVGVRDLTFRFRGRTAHAGGSPHLGRSALDAVELMNVGVNYLREHVTEKVRIHYVVTRGGELPNVVPETAESWYYVRALDTYELEQVAARVKKIAEGAALMTETSFEVTLNGACSSVLNNHYLADLHFEAMQKLGPIAFSEDELAFARTVNGQFPPEAVRPFEGMRVPEEMRERVAAAERQPLIAENFPAWDEDRVATGSTDVGDVSWIAPLSMLSTACFPTGAPGHSWANTAAAGSSIGHKGMMHAARIMTLVGIDLYSDPAHLERAHREFDARTAGRPYRSPLPDALAPPQFPEQG
jgi:aminobenzoyl-glutamate utilization protein B